jgi:hypothetical protein
MAVNNYLFWNKTPIIIPTGVVKEKRRIIIIDVLLSTLFLKKLTPNDIDSPHLCKETPINKFKKFTVYDFQLI